MSEGAENIYHGTYQQPTRSQYVEASFDDYTLLTFDRA
jgi:hypothetical protein